MVDKWEFDVPSGIWMNAGLSYNVLHSAENLAGQRTVEFNGPPLRRGTVCSLDGRSHQVHEYGVAVTLTDTTDGALAYGLGCLIQHLAKVIPNVTAWIEKPHLRRSDASRIVCSCGATYEMPTDFGRVALHNDHLAANPDHAFTTKQMPGKSMCFYGIGLGAVVATATLPEGAEFPTIPSCNKPTIHASDCECATL